MNLPTLRFASLIAALAVAAIEAATAPETFRPDWRFDSGAPSAPVRPDGHSLRFNSHRVGWGAADWDVGTQPFTLVWEAEIERGDSQPWRYPGVYVALATAAPDAMDDDTVAVLIGMHLDGLSASVRRGRTFDPNTNETGWPPRYARVADTELSRRFELNQSNAGGRWYSLEWPSQDLADTRLAFRLARTPTNTLAFTFYHAELDKGRTPWWHREWPIPPRLADVSFKHVVVRTVVNPTDYRTPGRPPEGGPIIGRLHRMQGRSGAAAAGLAGGMLADVPAPGSRVLTAVAPCEALPAGGGVVTVKGAGFDDGTVITFGGRPASPVQRVDAGNLIVTVPPGAPGRAKVAAAGFTGSPAFAYAGHPYLFYRADELADLRRKFNEPAFAAYRAVLLANAAEVPPEGAVTEKSGVAGIDDLAWASVLTGDARYRKRLFAAMAEESRSLNHEQFRMMAGAAMAAAYDMLFAEMEPELKTAVQQYLARVVRVYLGRVRRNDWWMANNPSNVIPVGALGGGLAGLALMHVSDDAAEAARLAPATVRDRYAAMTEDGGCVEGSLYWNYGFTKQLVLGHALHGATGDDGGLLDSPAIRNSVRFVETQLGGDGSFFTFNDTQPWLTGWAICADLGSRFEQPLMLWMADWMAARFAARRGAPENSRGDVSAYAFLLRSRQSAPRDFPGVPTAAFLPVLNWGVLRSDGNLQPKLVVGIKGRDGPMTHHVQADLGSFVLQAGSDAFLIDPGYYQPAAESHSLPLINGKGPEARATARISDCRSKGEMRTLALDATDAYQTTGATSFRRIFVMSGSRGVAVLDDIAAAATVRSLFQCGQPPSVAPAGRTAVLDGKAGRLAATFDAPELTLVAGGTNHFGRSWIFRRMAEAGEIAWHTLQVDYTPSQDQPLVSVFLPFATHAPPPVAIIRRQRNTVQVTRDGVPLATFRRDAGHWKAE